MHQVRLSTIAAAAAIMLGLLSAGTASAAVNQPGVPQVSGPFRIGPSDSPGTVALTANGSRIAVFDIKSGNGQTHVCLIAPTGRSCSHSTFLLPPSSDNTFGTPGVFITSANHVVVLQNTCCDANPNSTVLYRSADGGKTFAAPVRVASLGADVSEIVGGKILFTTHNNGSGLQIASVPVGASSPSPTATITTRLAFDTALGQYQGSALIGTDFNNITYIYRAAKGSNFGAASSYHSVAKITGETVLSMSGGALLTSRVNGGTTLLRMFNGTRFGPAHRVTHLQSGLLSWITVNQDPSGHVHVFAVLSTVSYHLIEVSTSNGGTTWSPRLDLGHAITSTTVYAALNAHGRGMVIGNSPALGYPVP